MTARIGALFAGYGGLERGVASVLDTELAWVSEIDPAPSRILAHHWPDVPNLGDITKVDWTQVEPVDVITGGSPCQDLSHAGKRAGMAAGTRSGLWASMCDAIDIIRPALVVWENVRGALSATATPGDLESCEFCVGGDGEPPLRALGRVLGDLADVGYDAAWCGLRAADVGAPHGRFRVFVLAWPAADAESGRRGKGRAEPAGVVGRSDAAQRGAEPPADADSVGGERVRAARDGRPGPADRGRAPADADRDGLESLRGLRPVGRDADRCRGAGQAAPVTLLPTPLVGSTSPAAHGQISGQYHAAMDEALANFGDYTPAIARWEAVLGRPAPAPTEPTGKGGARRLSARFVEFLMGLPDGWVTDVPGVTRNHALKVLGNGCVPQQVAAAVAHLLTVRSHSYAEAV